LLFCKGHYIIICDRLRSRSAEKYAFRQELIIIGILLYHESCPEILEVMSFEGENLQSSTEAAID